MLLGSIYTLVAKNVIDFAICLASGVPSAQRKLQPSSHLGHSVGEVRSDSTNVFDVVIGFVLAEQGLVQTVAHLGCK